jgi:hypothetical protein
MMTDLPALENRFIGKDSYGIACAFTNALQSDCRSMEILSKMTVLDGSSFVVCWYINLKESNRNRLLEYGLHTCSTSMWSS